MGTLIPEERRLIDAAVACGEVTQIARGKTSFSGYIWDPRQAMLVPKKEGTAFSASWNRRQKSKGARRRAVVERELKAGKTTYQIAADWGVGESTVRGDCRRLGIRVGSDGRLRPLLEPPS
ncbi:hypothetical protein AADZ90_021280 [Aestuariibius sp. 2305UL40-4]|uniref:hypothetical protein n=1 Tax=Aestuariibius violaceus TaxID=3234132 RepID=UPI00345E8AF2